MAIASDEISVSYRKALDRLIRVALGDMGQSQEVAEFLLAWWNAEDWGGFDPTELLGLDTSIAVDVVMVFKMISEHQSYPDTLGYGSRFEQLVKLWGSIFKKKEN